MIGKLACELDIPDSRIHPVVSISWLEPAPDPQLDPFQRSAEINPLPVAPLALQYVARDYASAADTFSVR
jgi:hypothetical protein